MYFLLGSVLAGVNPVAIRVSNRELDPLWGAGLRFGAAALLLYGVMLVMRLPFPRGRALFGTVAYGVLAFGVAFSLGYYALVRVHAGLAQAVLAIIPLATLLLAVSQRQERLRREAIVGALLALAGICVLVRAPLNEGVPLASLLALLGCALAVAQATVAVRRMPQVHPVTMNAIGMAVGASLQLLASLLVREHVSLPQKGSTWLALGYMVAFGSVVVYILYIAVLGRWDASRAAYSFVVIPLVTVGLSLWLDNEPLRLGLVAGGLMILAGVYIGALRSRAVAPQGGWTPG
jgi:drug/metabolite transporter (DMT)-like permease